MSEPVDSRGVPIGERGPVYVRAKKIEQELLMDLIREWRMDAWHYLTGDIYPPNEAEKRQVVRFWKDWLKRA